MARQRSDAAKDAIMYHDQADFESPVEAASSKAIVPKRRPVDQHPEPNEPKRAKLDIVELTHSPTLTGVSLDVSDPERNISQRPKGGTPHNPYIVPTDYRF